MRRKIVLLFLLLLSFTYCENNPSNKNSPVIPISAPVSQEAVKQSLAKGINLSNWFNDYSDPAQFSSRFSSPDFERIKRQGFTYVRLPVGGTILFQESNPSQLNAKNLVFVDAAIKNAIDAGLAVLLDGIHENGERIEKKLATTPGYVDTVTAYWKAVATYFVKYPADKIFFELFNEPHVAASKTVNVTTAWWRPVQEKLIKAVHAIAPNHYIVVGGESWNSLKELLSMEPYTAPNIIYNFHDYDPFLFTHQGASWAGWAPAVNGRNIPYPSNPEVVAPLVAAATMQELKDALTNYGNQRIGIDTVMKRIKLASDWASKNNALLMCNEFGSYKPYSPRASRLAWINDMRSALEKNNILWAMWEYDEGFGIMSYTNGNRNLSTADEEVLQSLGLK